MKSLKSMSKKERKEVLIKVAVEVQDLCEFEPAIKTDGKAEKDLIVTLKEAHAELTPEDTLSKEAIAVFTFLGLIEEEEEEEAVDTDALIEEVESAKTLKQLRGLLGQHDIFSSIGTGKIPIDQLRADMLECLGVVPEEEEPEEEEEAPKKKAKGKKAKMEVVKEEEEPEEEEEEEPKKKVKAKKDKKDKKPVKPKGDKAPSNKGLVYAAFADGEEDTKKLSKVVKGVVKESTIRSWVNNWKKGKKLPAGV